MLYDSQEHERPARVCHGQSCVFDLCTVLALFGLGKHSDSELDLIVPKDNQRQTDTTVIHVPPCKNNSSSCKFKSICVRLESGTNVGVLSTTHEDPSDLARTGEASADTSGNPQRVASAQRRDSVAIGN